MAFVPNISFHAWPIFSKSDETPGSVCIAAAAAATGAAATGAATAASACMGTMLSNARLEFGIITLSFYAMIALRWF